MLTLMLKEPLNALFLNNLPKFEETNDQFALSKIVFRSSIGIWSRLTLAVSEEN